MMDDESRAAIVADVKRELSAEMGLLPLTLLRDRRNSFVELNSYDDKGASNYGTAGYLGHGYFITVKHAVVALGQEGLADPRRIETVKLTYKGRAARRPRRRLRRRARGGRSRRLGDREGEGADRSAAART